MLGKFYEDVFDVELFCQMVDLICRLSEHAQKERLYGELENHFLHSFSRSSFCKF